MKVDTKTPGDKGTGDKLLAGKYKDVPALEKAYKEAQVKLTQLGQEKSKLDGDLQKLQLDKLTDAKESQERLLRAAQVRVDGERKALAQEMADAFDANKGSPAKALSLIDRMIQQHPSVKGGMSREDYERSVQDKSDATVAMNKVRSDHMQDFDLLKPKMSKLWDKLPVKARVPEMLETVYLAARAASEPEIREKIIQEMRAGSSTGVGVNIPPETNTDEDKMVDAVVDEHQKGKKW